MRTFQKGSFPRATITLSAWGSAGAPLRVSCGVRWPHPLSATSATITIPFATFIGFASPSGTGPPPEFTRLLTRATTAAQCNKPRRRSSMPSKGKAKAKATSSGEQATGEAASKLIDQRIRDLGGWRGETLARMRALILEADPEMTEEWKWMGTPVWSHHGIVCTGESYTKVVKLTFARGV